MTTKRDEPRLAGCAESLGRAKALAWTFAAGISPGRSLFEPDLVFHGPAPVGDLKGREAFETALLEPIRAAMPQATKRPYLYFGGEFMGHVWVGATGNIEGEMTLPLFGVPPGKGSRKLRFGEFYRFEGDRIAEIRCLLDIPGLAHQAGIEMFPPFSGRARIPEGPPAEVGIVKTPQDQDQTETTRSLVENMIVGGCNSLEGSDMTSQGLEQYWHEDMAWHGPWGIGSAYGLQEFYDYAQGPSVRSFPGRKGSWPKKAFVAEARVAGFAGQFLGTFSGVPFRGIEPTGRKVTKRVMDFYTSRGGRLAENWVLIDLIRFASDCGVDLMGRLPEDPASAAA
ncbi:MAG: ester cyclase [Boseongicola sp.]|nr:ester cyclase [Boseongicola sp.]